jgi:hypothetical protein
VSRVTQGLQWAGLALFFATLFLPVFHFRVYPIAGLTVPATGVVLSSGEATARVGFHAVGAREVPAQVLGAAIAEGLQGPSFTRPFWERRRWYPYFLLPIWLLALVLGQRRERWRRPIGVLLWLLAFGLALFEARYLQSEYAPFLPGVAGRAEGVFVWLLVLSILFYRRPQDRHLGAIEACVASQALLGFVHALTLPSTMARGWWDAFPHDAVIEAVTRNYPPPFWLGCAGLLLIALPIYLRRTRTASDQTGEPEARPAG